MDFRLPDDHAALAALARTILREHSAPDRLARLELDGGWIDRELWDALAGAGLVGISLPEDVGGGGLDALATHVLLAEVGACAAHVPLYETAVLGASIVSAVASAAIRTSVVADVVAGRRILTAALEDEGGQDPTNPVTRAEADGDGFVLTGVKTLVPCAAIADDVVLTAVTDDGQLVITLVETVDLDIQAQRTPSDVPHSRIVLERVAVPAERVLATGAQARDALAVLLDHATVGLASMQSGVVAEAVVMAARHTSTREQFGRAIATFQAVRQRVADARIASEMLSLTSLQASWMLSEGQAAHDEILIAKWWACEAGHVALHAVQHVHGGIGVDREYPLHRLFGRAKSIEFALGHGELQLRALGLRIAASVPDEDAA